MPVAIGDILAVRVRVVRVDTPNALVAINGFASGATHYYTVPLSAFVSDPPPCSLRALQDAEVVTA